MPANFHRPWHFELGELRKKNNNRQSVYKAQHHRMRHQPDKFPPLHDAGKDLQDPHQHHGGEQILNAMLCNQGDHHNRQRPCCTRNHPGAPPDHRRDQSYQKRSIKPNQRVNTSNEGKSHRFRNESQGHGETRKQFDAQPRRAQPFIIHHVQIGHGQIGKRAEDGTFHKLIQIAGSGFKMSINAFFPKRTAYLCLR